MNTPKSEDEIRERVKIFNKSAKFNLRLATDSVNEKDRAYFINRSKYYSSMANILLWTLGDIREDELDVY